MIRETFVPVSVDVVVLLFSGSQQASMPAIIVHWRGRGKLSLVLARFVEKQLRRRHHRRQSPATPVHIDGIEDALRRAPMHWVSTSWTGHFSTRQCLPLPIVWLHETRELLKRASAIAADYPPRRLEEECRDGLNY